MCHVFPRLILARDMFCFSLVSLNDSLADSRHFEPRNSQSQNLQQAKEESNERVMCYIVSCAPKPKDVLYFLGTTA